MADRYYIPSAPGSLAAIVSIELEAAPENGVLITDDNRGFQKPCFSDNQYSQVIETMTQADIDLAAKETRSQLIQQEYEKRKADGWKAYQDFRADMVMEIYDNVLTKPQAFVIEDYLGGGYEKIAQQGDWETAYFKLGQIVLPAQYNFVQPYLDKAKLIIGEYVQQNYRPL